MGKYKFDVKYDKLFPDLSAEAVEYLKENDLKRKYQQYDLKAETFVYDNEKGIAAFVPSREDSLERLIDLEHQFSSEESVEDAVCHSMMVEKLLACLKKLDKDEYSLIFELFYAGKTERQLSAETDIPQKTINDRRKKILCKLLKLMES